MLDIINNLKENKSRIEGFIYTFLIFLSSISVSQLPKLYCFYLIFIVGIFINIYYLYQKRKNIKDVFQKKEFKIAFIFILTEFCVVIYSFIIMGFFSSNIISGSFSRAFGIFVYLTIVISEALCITDYLGKERAVRLTLLGICINYLLTIVISLYGCGFNLAIILDYLIGKDVKGSGILLEAHELAPCFATGIIYLILNRTILKKERNIFLVILSIFIVLCGKRIITFSLIIILLLYFLYVKFINKYKYNVIYIIPWFELLVAYIYVYMIKSKAFLKIMYSLGINMMQRDTLYNAMDYYYYFSPAFLGRGSGFTSKWLDNNWMNINIYGATTSLGLHNDFLRHYIELGFFGYFAYLFSLLFVIPYKIKKLFGSNAVVKYMFLFAFQLICWTVDQITVYYIYQLVFFIVLFSSLEKD